MKKIAVIATGGTIEMTAVRGKAGFTSTNYIKKMLHGEPTNSIDLHRLARLDSSDMGIRQWQELISFINKYRQDYAGFVITHGTDTMPYTAAALAFALRADLNFPVLLTGSMRTPNLANSDAASNLSAALRLAVSDLAEVAIVMQKCAWRGTRSQKVTGMSQVAFATPGIACLARLDKQNRPRIYAHAKRRRQNTSRAHHHDSHNIFSRNLCFLQAVPGVCPPAVLPQNIKTVLLTASGGNLPPDFLDMVERNSRLGITQVIGSTVADRGSVVYPPLARALKMGALTAVRYNQPALVVKLSFLLAQSEQAGHTDAERTAFIGRELAVPYAAEI